MRPKLSIRLNDNGHVCANVPAEWMWDLVEFLSFQRLHVDYHYGVTHFVVQFPRQDEHTVRQVLDDWSNNEDAPTPVTAEGMPAEHSGMPVAV